jgi:rhodanese-related sulfurtransferase
VADAVEVPEIDPAAARDAIAGGAGVLDVREPWEFAQGHIDGATLVPLGDLSGRAGDVPEARPLVVYCAVGARSAAAVDWLRRNGRPDAVNLAGGIQRWMTSGLPVV